jgi:hypothetical protein
MRDRLSSFLVSSQAVHPSNHQSGSTRASPSVTGPLDFSAPAAEVVALPPPVTDVGTKSPAAASLECVNVVLSRELRRECRAHDSSTSIVAYRFPASSRRRSPPIRPKS